MPARIIYFAGPEFQKKSPIEQSSIANIAGEGLRESVTEQLKFWQAQLQDLGNKLENAKYELKKMENEKQNLNDRLTLLQNNDEEMQRIKIELEKINLEIEKLQYSIKNLQDSIVIAQGQININNELATKFELKRREKQEEADIERKKLRKNIEEKQLHDLEAVLNSGGEGVKTLKYAVNIFRNPEDVTVLDKRAGEHKGPKRFKGGPSGVFSENEKVRIVEGPIDKNGEKFYRVEGIHTDPRNKNKKILRGYIRASDLDLQKE